MVVLDKQNSGYEGRRVQRVYEDEQSKGSGKKPVKRNITKTSRNGLKLGLRAIKVFHFKFKANLNHNSKGKDDKTSLVS